MSVTTHIDYISFSVLFSLSAPTLWWHPQLWIKIHWRWIHVLSFCLRYYLKMTMCVVAPRHLLKTVSLSLFLRHRRACYVSIFSKLYTTILCALLLFSQNMIWTNMLSASMFIPAFLQLQNSDDEALCSFFFWDPPNIKFCALPPWFLFLPFVPIIQNSLESRYVVLCWYYNLSANKISCFSAPSKYGNLVRMCFLLEPAKYKSASWAVIISSLTVCSYHLKDLRTAETSFHVKKDLQKADGGGFFCLPGLYVSCKNGHLNLLSTDRTLSGGCPSNCIRFFQAQNLHNSLQWVERFVSV